MPQGTVSGSVPLSKNQRNLAKKRKNATPTEHGGTCNKCGQKSTSCTTGEEHLNCAGGCQEDISDLLAAQPSLIGHLQGRWICHDGSKYDETSGVWMNPSQLDGQKKYVADMLAAEKAALVDLHEQEKKEAADHLETHLRNIRTFYYKDDPALGYFVNGMNEPIDMKTGKVMSEEQLTAFLAERTEEVLRKKFPIEAAAIDAEKASLIEAASPEGEALVRELAKKPIPKDLPAVLDVELAGLFKDLRPVAKTVS